MLYFKIPIVVLGCKYGNPYGYDCNLVLAFIILLLRTPWSNESVMNLLFGSVVCVSNVELACESKIYLYLNMKMDLLSSSST
jgi:hypothetical protein